jgi:VanZ family protein
MNKIVVVLRKYPLSLLTLVLISCLSLGRGTSSVPSFTGLDKIAHLLMYAFLCVVIWFEYYRSHTMFSLRKMVMGAVVAPVLFSGMLELFQEYLTTYRSGDVVDFLFNTLGVLFAAVIGRYVIRPLVFRLRSTDSGVSPK